MKIAVSHNNTGRISPVFDVAENVLLLDIDECTERKRENVVIVGNGIFEKAQAVSKTGASILICGAVSIELENALRAQSLDVKSFICGESEAVIEAFLAGRLNLFIMPGCCNRRHMHKCSPSF